MTADDMTEKTDTQPHERIVLSERDFLRLVEMIESPPPPTQKLREAMAEYRRLQAAHPESNL